MKNKNIFNNQLYLSDNIVSFDKILSNFDNINRVFNYIGAAGIFIAIYWLFTIKHHVQDLTLQLQEVKQQIQQEQDAIHVFRAELSYLRSPKRIKDLTNKYLALQPVQPEQIVKSGEKHDLKKYSKLVTKYAKKTNKQLANWRYKKAPSRYVIEVSTRN